MIDHDKPIYTKSIADLFHAVREHLETAKVKHQNFSNEELQEMLLEDGISIAYNKERKVYYFAKK